MINEREKAEFLNLIDRLTDRIASAVNDFSMENEGVQAEDVLISSINASAYFAILAGLPKEAYMHGCETFFDQHKESLQGKLND